MVTSIEAILTSGLSIRKKRNSQCIMYLSNFRSATNTQSPSALMELVCVIGQFIWWFLKIQGSLMNLHHWLIGTQPNLLRNISQWFKNILIDVNQNVFFLLFSFSVSYFLLLPIYLSLDLAFSSRFHMKWSHSQFRCSIFWNMLSH